MSWKINQAKLDEAREILEIEYPVRVRQTIGTSIEGMAGKYHGLGHWGPTTEERLDTPAHHISVRGSIDAKGANTILWHEMCHAAQAEDFLPEGGAELDGREPYQMANKGLRQAFRTEMTEIRNRKGGSMYSLSPSYGDVSFEVEARDVMKDADKLMICESVETEVVKKGEKNTKPAEDKDDPYKGHNGCWRVDLFDSKNQFVATEHVLAKDEFDAKNWARKKHGQDGKNWTMNVKCYQVYVPVAS